MAHQVMQDDDEVDALYDQVYRELLLFMIQDPKTIEKATYLLWAATGQIVMSGTWNKWTLEDTTWTDEGTAGNDNRYGSDCGSDYGWCSEDFGTPATRGAVRPGLTDDCEASIYNTSGGTVTCGTPDWTLTIHVGGSRLAACGF